AVGPGAARNRRRQRRAQDPRCRHQGRRGIIRRTRTARISVAARPPLHMIHVDCPSCHASYELDERRVPPGGMMMRCPKCRTRFEVSSDKPAEEGGVDLPARPGRESVEDLPAPASQGAGSLDADLPAPSGHTDFPAPALEGRGAYDADLPAPSGSTDLPAPAG